MRIVEPMSARMWRYLRWTLPLAMAAFVMWALMGCSGMADGDDMPADVPVDAGDPGSLAEDMQIDGPITYIDGPIEKTTFWPAGFGSIMAAGTGDDHHGERCYMATTGCKRPRSKVFAYSFSAGTCSSWYQARVVAATAEWQNKLNSKGWTITTPGSGQIKISCDTTIPYTAVFATSDLVCDANNLCTWQKGTVKINPTRVESESNWAAATEGQRIVDVVNILRHEMYHSTGLGHWSTAPLMRPNYGLPFYQATQALDSDENAVLLSFAP